MSAACGGDGVHLEVVVPEGMAADHVDLFVAKGAPCVLDDQGTLCDRIAPPRFASGKPRDPIDGLVFEEDAQTEPLEATVEDGSAWFFLAPTKATVKLLIAVAHDNQEHQIGAAIVLRPQGSPIRLDDGDQYLSTTLEPTSAVLGEGTPAVQQWAAPDASYACVGAQLAGMPLFIVPREDPDCDQVAADRECAATTFLAKDGVSDKLEDLSCATQVVGSACELGDRPCDETMPAITNNRCITPTDVRYCVPDPACGCDAIDGACKQLFIDRLTNGSVTPPSHIECRLATEDDGNGGITVCQQPMLPVALSTAMGTCGTTVGIADFDFTFGQLMPSFDITDGGSTVTLTPTLGSTDCEFSIPPPTDTFAMELTGQYVLVVELETMRADSGNRATSVILPLTIEIGAPGNCMLEESICTFLPEPGDQVTKCFP